MSSEPSFSQRFGFRGPEAPITVREDAPASLREALPQLADSLGLSPDGARDEVCRVLLVAPNANNWSAYPNVFNEVQGRIMEAPWHRVYDIAERFHDRLASARPPRHQEFEHRLNELFREQGIGWAMQGGRIVARGSEAFAGASRAASALMASSGRQTAATEMHEALADLSRRPAADITGAIQHAMAALECVARDVSGQPTRTLGQIIPTLGLTRPLDEGLEKLWGFASEYGRHVREGRTPRFEDAELVVTVASAISTYLIRTTNGRPAR
jgi:hypothetical protein